MNNFSPKTLDFLNGLQFNNNKAWFEAHKQDYENYLLDPLRELVVNLGGFMLDIDPDFEVRPAVNKTISRIYRDTRFSKDKSPYKTTMWITFKKPVKDWQNKPSYFFELSASSYRYGMGFYCAGKEAMDNLREKMAARPADFQRAISFYANQQDFVVEGEKYKRLLSNDLPAAMQDWYQRKNLYLVCNSEIDDALFSKELVNNIKSGFTLIAPFYNYLTF